MENEAPGVTTTSWMHSSHTTALEDSRERESRSKHDLTGARYLNDWCWRVKKTILYILRLVFFSFSREWRRIVGAGMRRGKKREPLGGPPIEERYLVGYWLALSFGLPPFPSHPFSTGPQSAFYYLSAIQVRRSADPSSSSTSRSFFYLIIAICFVCQRWDRRSLSRLLCHL